MKTNERQQLRPPATQVGGLELSLFPSLFTHTNFFCIKRTLREIASFLRVVRLIIRIRMEAL